MLATVMPMFSLRAHRRRGVGDAGGGSLDRQVRVVRWGIGHDPGRILVRAGHPIALVFERLDSDSATECVSIPALGRVSMLRVRTRVELDPCAVGEYELCSRGGEVRGMLVVVP